MAKGENLEKPKKKGGMVIVIGMGAKPKGKPKDSMKKSFGRGSDDAKLAGRAKTLRRLRSGRRNIDDILARRKVDPDEFHGEFRRRHGMDFDDYLKDDSAKIDAQALIDELAEKRFGAAKKTAVEGQQRRENRAKKIRENLLNTSKFKGMLRNQGISEGQWRKAVNKIPMTNLTRNTFNELVDKLGTGKPRPSRKTGSQNENVITYEGDSQPYDRIFHEYDRANAGEYDDADDDADAQDRRAEESSGRRNVKVQRRAKGARYYDPYVEGTAEIKDELPQDSDEESRALRFYERLYSHRPNPTQLALQQLGRGAVSDQNRQDIEGEFSDGQRPDTTPSTVFTKPNAPVGFRAGSPDEDEDPNVRFDAASIGATTPKSETANPRELPPFMRPREGQGEERIIRPFRMQTSFDDPKNVMNAAWALLKSK